MPETRRSLEGGLGEVPFAGGGRPPREPRFVVDSQRLTDSASPPRPILHYHEDRLLPDSLLPSSCLSQLTLRP